MPFNDSWAALQRYFALLAFSALNFAHLALVAFEIRALASADIVFLCVTPVGVTTEAECEPFNAAIAVFIPLS
jgi:hypothetical protein